MKRDILFIVHNYDYKTRGGVLKVVTMLSNEFVSKNNVKILSLGESNKLPYDLNNNVEVLSLGLKKYDTRFYKSFFKIIWFLKVFLLFICKYNLIKNNIILTTSPPLNMVLGFLKLFDPKIIIIGCDHTTANYKNKGLLSIFKNFLYKRINNVIALTKDDCEIYKKNNIKSVYIPNPIERNFKKNKNNLKNRLLYVGRFSKEKRPELAIEQYFKSKLWLEGVDLYMYGYGSHLEQMNTLIDTYDIKKHIHIYSDVSDPELIYENGYALLMTSEIEGFGMVLLEAMVRGIPCVSYDAPFGPKNIIINNVNGYLTSNIDGLHKLISKEKINFLYEKNICESIKKFNIDEIIEQWEMVFEMSLENDR